MIFRSKKNSPITSEPLLDRQTLMAIENRHYITSNPIAPPFPKEMHKAMFGLGCFWGAEKRFWMQQGVFSTAVGYAGGDTPNPDYEEVCTGMTGHNEVVLVIFNPEHIDYQKLLTVFWESHNPTQGMHQGNDVGTQYRSGVYTYSEEQIHLAELSRFEYQKALNQAGFPSITTEILKAPEFYYAENYHQQYLAKNLGGYCGLGGTGICFTGE